VTSSEHMTASAGANASLGGGEPYLHIPSLAMQNDILLCWRQKKDVHSAQFEPILLLHTAVGVNLRNVCFGSSVLSNRICSAQYDSTPTQKSICIVPRYE
jgi:hypothetical protein